MDFIEYLFTFTASFFITASVVMFLHCFYDTHFKWHWKKVVAFILWNCLMVHLTGSLSEDSSLLWVYMALDLVFSCVVVFYDYGKGKIRGILRFFWMFILCEICLSQIIVTVITFLVPAKFNDLNYLMSLTETELLKLYDEFLLFSDQIVILFSVISTAFFALVFFYLYHRLYKPGIFIKCGARERIFGWIYSITFFVVGIVLTIYSAEQQIPKAIMSASFLLLGAILPVFIYYTRISLHYQKRTQFQEDLMEAELAHFRQYKQSQEETQRVRHDMKNNLLYMNDLLSQGKHREAAEHLKDLFQIVDTLSVRYVTGDEILDSIFAFKAQRMEQSKIRLTLDGVLAGGLPWKPVDICSVFANALDNAIEACEQLPEDQRYIRVSIKTSPQFWFIAIENSACQKIDTEKLFQKDNGYTSKSDTEHHGMGTYSIRRTAERYGGAVNANSTENSFVLEIMLHKNTQ